MKTNDEAMTLAIGDTLVSIAGSSLTTIAGFLALCTMQLTLNDGIIGLCFVLKTSLSNTNKNAGKIVTVERTPIKTPLAITIPISEPNVSCIVHKAKNPAIVVSELPAIVN